MSRLRTGLVSKEDALLNNKEVLVEQPALRLRRSDRTLARTQRHLLRGVRRSHLPSALQKCYTRQMTAI